MAPLKLPIWSCISGRASSNTPPEIVRVLYQVNFNGKRNTSALFMLYNSFKKNQILFFMKLMKVFYAGFLLLHSWQKPEVGVNQF